MEESERCNVRVLACIAVVEDDRVLIVREKAKPYTGMWVFPNGFVKENETVIEAATREIREELAMEVKVESLIGVYDDIVEENGRKIHYVIVCFTASKSTEDVPRASEEVVDYAWVKLNEIRAEMPDVYRKMVSEILSKKKKLGIF